jgi:hypothetical protein
MKIKYEKPSIKKVKLVPSEAVLSTCKNTQTVGPSTFALCNWGGPSNTNCLVLGS